jgi:hypothetical protein
LRPWEIRYPGAESRRPDEEVAGYRELNGQKPLTAKQRWQRSPITSYAIVAEREHRNGLISYVAAIAARRNRTVIVSVIASDAGSDVAATVTSNRTVIVSVITSDAVTDVAAVAITSYAIVAVASIGTDVTHIVIAEVGDAVICRPVGVKSRIPNPLPLEIIGVVQQHYGQGVHE